MEQIEVTFDINGEVQIEAKGFAGKDCVSASKFIEEALGVATETKFTADYYKNDRGQNIERQIS